MSKNATACLCLMISIFFISGCWDSSEVNDIAIELAWGIDDAPNQKIRISAQAIVPSKISGGQSDVSSQASKGKPYFVLASDGMNTLDAVQRMQTKLSREMFRGHRRVIVIGESMARRGVKEIFDTYSRDPNLKLRTDIFIVKGDTAQNFLKVSYPLENIPGIGVLGEYDQIGTASREMGLLNFLLAASSDSACPALPVVAIGMDPDVPDEQQGQAQSQADREGFRIVGTAIFNKELKMVGYIDMEKARAMRWVSGNLRKMTVSETLPQGKGNVSMDVIKTKSKINSAYQGGRLKILVTLTGQGAIRENNTNLDLTKTNNISYLEKALNRHAEEVALKTITDVQKEYGTDVFGFSDAIRRKDLALWKSMEDDWKEEFQRSEVTVKANMTVRRIGVTGPSLQLNPNEIKK
ncbi:spore germination protein KC [Cohnella sp. OV330]|uniref:Ger(x)C family spore germination protein n=1 Tax=Cohnella sp. OV330 TaxID=1855288 RepID=UPI0008E447D7|nr:Ger(x)C family spore germination protein [Cohnella sp. OV330]SFB45239.1 spore germination protein KC [Cohnella sp. OV330]